MSRNLEIIERIKEAIAKARRCRRSSGRNSMFAVIDSLISQLAERLEHPDAAREEDEAESETVRKR